MTNPGEGNDFNWNAVVDDLGPRLLSYFMAVFPRQVAADMVQETLLRLVLKVRDGKYDGNQGTLRMYAYGIARFVRLEGYRHQSSTVTPITSIDPDTLESQAEDEAQTDNAQALRLAIKQLKSIEQEIILLMIDKDLEYEAIGKILQMPVGTIKSHVFRAKASLKLILTDSLSADKR